MVDELLRAVQHSAFANWVQETAYPYVITLHSVGLALLVGLLVVIDLRVLGYGHGLPIPALRKLMTVVWIGFWTNFASGIMLFSIDAKKDFYSSLFRIKLSSIAVGLILGALIKRRVLGRDSEYAAVDARAPSSAKVLAVCSLLCWISAIIAGRLLAYFTFGDVGVDD
jgi:hypothetical protein